MNTPPRGVDFFDFQSLLSVEELQMRDMVREFGAAEIMPLVRQNWRTGTFPVELVRKMGEIGILGPCIEFEGSPCIGQLAHGLVMIELERVDAGVRSFASVQSLVMRSIAHYGSDEQKKRWLKALYRGEAIGAFAVSETDHGSDLVNMATKAVRNGDYYILNGSKMWITSGSIADIIIIWARTDDGMGAFIVERGTKGMTVNDIPGKHGMRMSVTSEIGLDDCAVPSSSRLPGARVLKDCLKLLNHARYSIAWGAIGAAEACFEETLSYVGTRSQFNKPLSSFQLVQEKLSSMACKITRCQLLCYHMARLEEAGKLRHHHISMAKRGNVRLALEVARTCRDLLGANGMTDDYCVFRHMANLEAQSTIDGTDHIHALITGQMLTGYQSFC